MTTVLLIRHGRTAANTEGILAGRSSGVVLDATGTDQALQVGQRIAGVPLRAIVTSPLRRCRQTAQALANARPDGCPVLVEQGLVECGYGEWTGKSLRELSKDKLWAAVQHQPSAVRSGGESMAEMATRSVAAVRLGRQARGRRGGSGLGGGLARRPDQGDPRRRTRHAPGQLPAHRRGPGLDLDHPLHRHPAVAVITLNSTDVDLGRLLSPPRRAGVGGRRRTDAQVGGGLGASDVVT